MCDTCDISCSVCYADVRNCSTCNVSGGYVFSRINSTTCVTTCDDGYYKDMNSNACLPCSSNCLTCVNSDNYCLTCGMSYGLQTYLLATDCIFPCPNGFYPNSYTNTCETCDISCLICTGPTSTECTACSNDTVNGVSTIYYLGIGQTICYATCPQGQYIDANIANLCQQCSSNCS